MNESFGNKFVGERFLSVDKKQAEKRERTITKLSETEGVNQDRLNERLKPVIERLAALEAKQPGRFSMTAKRYLEEATIDVNNPELISKLARALYESEKRIALERGYGADNSVPTDQEIIAKYEPVIIDKYNKQKESLETWFSYLEQNDANYPFWFRYYAARALKDMGKFERDTTSYSTRTEDTLAPFPELNAEALSFVYKALEQEFVLDHGEIPTDIEDKIIAEIVLDEDVLIDLQEKVPENKRDEAKANYIKRLQKQARKEFFKKQKDQSRQEYFKTLSLNEERRPELEAELDERLSSKNFAKLYAFAQVETAGNLDRSSTEGEWVKYDQGSDPELLEKNLKGKGTGWCTATWAAKEQLEKGDFYVFYSKNKAGIATEPRVAIRMENGVVAEIRGIDPGQELEPTLVDNAQEFYKDLPGAERYEKATKDMRRLTEIYNRFFDANNKTDTLSPNGTYFDVEELQFIFETKDEVLGFGYRKDPRISELKSLALGSCTRKNIVNTLKQENVENISDEQIYQILTDLELHELSSHFFKALIQEKISKGEIGTSEINIINKLINHEKTDGDIKDWLQSELRKFADPKFKDFLLEIFEATNDNELATTLIKNGNFIIVRYIDYFEDLDKSIALELIKAKRPILALNKFSKFKDLDYSTLANFLLNNRYAEFFIDNISSFEDLDIDIATQLIIRGEFETYIERISRFKKIDFEILTKAVLDAGGLKNLVKIYFHEVTTPEQRSILFSLIFENENKEISEAALVEIISKANAARIAGDTELFKMIINHGNKNLTESFCIKSLEEITPYHFEELDTQTIELLINTCLDLKLFKELADSAHKIPAEYINTEFLINLIDANINSFNKLITKLNPKIKSNIDDWKSKVLSQIDKSAIYEKLASTGRYSTLLMTCWFFDLDNNSKTQLASYGIENGLAPHVAHNFKNLKGCDFSIYEELIKKREVGRMLFHILDLPEDKLSVAIGLVIKTGQFDVLEHNMDKINKESEESGINYDYLANKFDFEVQAKERIEEIESLKHVAAKEGLDIETCKKIIDLGAAEEIFSFVNNLKGVTEQQIAEMTIDSIQAEALLENLHLLKNIDENKLIEKIDKTNQSFLFSKYYPKFRSALSEKLILLYVPFSIIEKGEENIKNMIEYAEKLTPKLAATLNANGYGHLVSKYSEKFKGDTIT